MKSLVKIMHLVFSLNIGGVENLVLNLLSKIDRSKYLPCVCSLCPDGVLEKEFDRISVPVYIVKKKDGIDYTLPFRLAKTFKENKVDILHTHNQTSCIYGVIGARFAQVPIIIYTEHSNLFANQKRLMIAERLVSMSIDQIIGDSDKVSNFLLQTQHLAPKRVMTIVNGIDTDKFSPSIRSDKSQIMKKNLYLESNDMVIGIIARLIPIKDHKTLFYAFKEVTQKFGNVKLIIVGDGELRKNLENLAENLNLSDRIIFLGACNDIPELLSIFDVFVLSSVSEGLPLALLEAMAAGVPAIATNVGGIPEVITSGFNGILVPPQNPQKMAGAIISLLSNINESQAISRNGRSYVESKFSLNAMVKKYENLYETFIHNKIKCL